MALPTNSLPEARSLTSEQRMIALLEEQNKILLKTNSELENLIKIESSLTRKYTNSTIIDLHIPIGSLIVLYFKWIIASIPVGIVIAAIYFFIAAIIGVSIF